MMKSKVFVVITLVLVLLLPACGALQDLAPQPLATPTVSSTPALTPTLTAIPFTGIPVTPRVVPDPQIMLFQMTDPASGWAYGETYLLHTADGGLTWLDVTPPGVTELGGNVSGYFFMDYSTAWLMIMDADPVLGSLFHTSDGGLTWTTGTIPFSGGSMQFLDGQHGYVMTSLGMAAGSEAIAIYQTSDSGASWTKIFTNAPDEIGSSDSLPFSGQKSGMTFLDVAHGWVGGNIPQSAFTYLYSTGDGGSTWNQQNLTLPPGFENAMLEVNAPVFFTPLDGVLPVRLLAEPVSFVFYVTHDGGLTWTPTFPLNFSGHYAMSSLLDLWLWDGSASMYVSHNSGLTWDPIPTNVNVSDTLVKFQFVDVNTGWMLTGDGSGQSTFYKTMDGGLNWNVIIP